jgi:hypothetical protein
VGERRALVIGAPNERFGELTFLADVVLELHRVLLDPAAGGCIPALPDGGELILGDRATRTVLVSAIGDAIRAAARDQATLFLYFVGHGHREEPDFYLVAADTPGPAQVDSENAVPLGQRIKELLRQNSTIDGIMLVIDACHSGALVVDPVPGLLREGMHARIEFFAATRPEDVASNGCFTRSLIELLKKGSAHSADPELRAYDEHARLRQVAPPGCHNLAPAVHLSLNGTPDAGLWLGRNQAADLRRGLVGTDGAAHVARLTRDWQSRRKPEQRLLQLVTAGVSPIAITGGAGSGKSALLASLGRRSAGDLVGLDALVPVRPGDTLAVVAGRLAAQLDRSDVFQTARSRWQAVTPVAVQEVLPEFHRLIVGPLQHLIRAEQVRIGVDAADLLDTLQRRRLIEAFTNLARVTLIVTGRRYEDISEVATLTLPPTDVDAVDGLIDARVDNDEARSRIRSLCGGEWLLARILIGLWHSGHLDVTTASDGG